MKKLAMLFGVLLCLSGLASTANALILNIDVGDRGYYTHGPGYWYGGGYYYWAPGHWGPYHHHWYHGHYVRR